LTLNDAILSDVLNLQQQHIDLLGLWWKRGDGRPTLQWRKINYKTVTIVEFQLDQK